MFNYNDVIEYIDCTYDENFNNALQWCKENNASLDEIIENRKEKDGILYRYFQINEIPKPTFPEINLTLEELKILKTEEINKARDRARLEEYAKYNNDIFDIDETSQSNILAQIKVAELLQNDKATYIYRSKSNQSHLFNVYQLQELGLTIAQKVSEIYIRSWDLKAKIDTAETIEEVNAIEWYNPGKEVESAS